MQISFVLKKHKISVFVDLVIYTPCSISDIQRILYFVEALLNISGVVDAIVNKEIE
jgi:hypothetical protein